MIVLPNLLYNPTFVAGLEEPLLAVAEVLEEQDKSEFAMSVRYAAIICKAFVKINLTKEDILYDPKPKTVL